jgi:hypothetical protein
MAHSKLTQSLERLQTEIEDLSIPDTEKRELESLVLNIRQALDQETDSGGADLQQSLHSTIVRFEASHPRLTAVLNDIMVTLSNMGI